MDNTDTDDNDDSNIGEGFEFDAIKVSGIGAQGTNTLLHVAAGLKFNDMAMCDPTSMSLLLLHAPDSLVQSCNLCFPLCIVIAKDKKQHLMV